MSNRYAGPCHYCGKRVEARAGEVIGKFNGRWRITHTACELAGGPEVVETYFPSTGNRVYRNKRGRCIDAPCCGCCT